MSLSLLEIICTLAVGHCIFMAIVLWTWNQRTSNRMLAILLVLLSIRIGKSLVGLIFVGHDYILSAFGLPAMAWSGPMAFFFLQLFFHSDQTFNRKQWPHFALGVVCPVLYPFIDWPVISILYYLATAYFVFYLVISFLYLFRNKATLKADDLRWRWSVAFLICMTLIGITYVLQMLVYEQVFYAVNISVSSLVLYGFTFYSFRASRLFEATKIRKSEDDNALKELGARIQRLLDENEVFVDPDLTVSKLAEKMQAQPYLVSKAVNHYFNVTFSELLIQYRIKKAEFLLVRKGEVFSIEGIAYESGFNSLSAFYAAFKKTHGITPSQFRKAKGDADMRVA